MKELDKLLTAYLDGDFRNASADDRSHFQELLELPDPQLYDYCLGRERPRVAAVASLIDRIAGRSIDFGPLTRTLPVP
jgi:succinate dehydrogenase flavin-adding protein (antitoxin of CptAB toxin-antitoxin module)